MKMFNGLYARLFLNIPEYIPTCLTEPAKKLDVVSAWRGLELVIADIMARFHIPNRSCLEFGVEFGFSTVALSNYFEKVKGVDLFTGDMHTTHKGDHYAATAESLSPYPNIELFKADYRDWIAGDHDRYDLIHVDIVHTYQDTFACGLWSAQHSKCTLFHDTESFTEVRKAVRDIAKRTGKRAFNYPKSYGLGIIV